MQTLNMDSGKIKKMQTLTKHDENRYSSEKNYELDEESGRQLPCVMEAYHRVSKFTSSEAELEVLIAKYTLEYLYRWTNQFDPNQLAQIKQIFDIETEPEVLLKMITGAASRMQS